MKRKFKAGDRVLQVKNYNGLPVSRMPENNYGTVDSVSYDKYDRIYLYLVKFDTQRAGLREHPNHGLDNSEKRFAYLSGSSLMLVEEVEPSAANDPLPSSCKICGKHPPIMFGACAVCVKALVEEKEAAIVKYAEDVIRNEPDFRERCKEDLWSQQRTM